MAVLDGLAPEKVFKYFEKICEIPHGSTDTKKISDYCVDFAKQRSLKYVQDNANNVIIYKDGTKSHKDSAPVILQGHLDMVCEKDEETDIDFKKDGIRLELDGDTITAKGTTLGGDDGIAIAYALAILDSDDIEHPPLECVFTVDEEIGMLGADVLDMSKLSAKRLINIDSEDEGHLLSGCAGGVTSTVHIGVTTDRIREREDGRDLLTISIEHLAGGHSGVEIDKGRANANILLGRLLYEIRKKDVYNIVMVEGGAKDNAIPRSASAIILTKDKKAVKDVVSEYESIYKHEYRYTDPLLSVKAEDGGDISHQNGDEKDIIRVMDDGSTDRVITALMTLPNGVMTMCHEPAGLVQTSLNMGILRTTKDEVCASFSVRSSLSSERDALVSKLECIATSLGGSVENTGAYPAWEYKDDSKLRDIFLETYKEQYDKDMVVETIHAGVECGLFADRIDGLDAVSFGPDMKDIHTPAESLSVSSAVRTWELLLGVLDKL